ncbi:helix-turn-helix domain-containing protein [Rhizobium sp. CRIBSB]|nr:helix-turn-helix domain-containing protein [Rhizobium sp. CRIBSB]
MPELRLLSRDCRPRPADAACSACGARAFSVCGGVSEADLGRLEAVAEKLTVRAGQGMARQGDRADHVFNVTSGSVRVFRLLPDGRRQITGFLFAGDVFGLAPHPEYAFSAEAMEDATVCRFRRADYQGVVREIPALEASLLERVTHELAAAQNQMLLLGRKTAQERIASFILAIADRDPLRPDIDGHVRLAMTRAEIADYTGLTIETVSRVFTRLKTAGIIRLLSVHDLRIEQPERLRVLAEGRSPGL